MSTNFDTGIMELLASKICHDLISPIGAVNNGIEFLQEMGADAGQDVIDLITFSASQASAKLQAYRIAYGAGGADPNIKPEDIYNAIDKIVGAEKKITQNWDPHAPLGSDEKPAAFCKMLISAIFLGMESLPKGGEVSVGTEGNSTVVTVKGENAALREHSNDALRLMIRRENLEPKNIHAYITGLMAAHYGFEISVSEGDDKVDITVSAA